MEAMEIQLPCTQGQAVVNGALCLLRETFSRRLTVTLSAMPLTGRDPKQTAHQQGRWSIARHHLRGLTFACGIELLNHGAGGSKRGSLLRGSNEQSNCKDPRRTRLRLV
jgi:hypothetical protein